MKKFWAFVAVFALGVGVILLAGTSRGEKQIVDWLVGSSPQGGGFSFASSYKLAVSEGESGVDVTYTCEISLDNLWDPWFLSGPVRSTTNTFRVGRVEIVDVTNNLAEQPDWWNAQAMCFDEGLGDGQIWKVTLDVGFGPTEPQVGWFWVCEEVADAYQGTFTVEWTDMLQVNVCEYEITEASAYTVRFEFCMDQDGNPVTLEIAAPLDDPHLVGDILQLQGSVNSCLHKGRGGNNYVTHAMNCNVYDIDIGGWEEFFIGGDARAYGDEAVAYWEAVNDFAVDGCADHSWVCLLPIPVRHLHLIEGDWGPLYLTDSGAADGVGFRKRVPGETWVPRGLVPNTDDADWACSVMSASQGPNLVRDGGGGSYMRQAVSHNNQWLADRLPIAALFCPDAVYYEGHWYVAACMGESTQYLLRLNRYGDWDTVDSGVIAASDNRPACLCLAADYGRLHCAVEHDGVVHVYSSSNMGASWKEKFTQAGWEYPRLFSERTQLWLVGFKEEDNDEDADGRLYMLRRDQSLASLPPWSFADGSSTVRIGESDDGRAGFISRHNKPFLTVCAVKNGAWNNDGPTTPAQGFVQYDSTDFGMNWHREGVYSHA